MEYAEYGSLSDFVAVKSNKFKKLNDLENNFNTKGLCDLFRQLQGGHHYFLKPAKRGVKIWGNFHHLTILGRGQKDPSALAGIHHLHNIKLSHLDLKPDNILLADCGDKLSDFGARVIISDFGLAKRHDPGTKTGDGGTARFQSPEQYYYQPNEKLFKDFIQAGVLGESKVSERRTKKDIYRVILLKCEIFA